MPPKLHTSRGAPYLRHPYWPRPPQARAHSQYARCRRLQSAHSSYCTGAATITNTYACAYNGIRDPATRRAIREYNEWSDNASLKHNNYQTIVQNRSQKQSNIRISHIQCSRRLSIQKTVIYTSPNSAMQTLNYFIWFDNSKIKENQIFKTICWTNQW